jgi:ribosomal protein L24E
MKGLQKDTIVLAKMLGNITQCDWCSKKIIRSSALKEDGYYFCSGKCSEKFWEGEKD